MQNETPTGTTKQQPSGKPKDIPPWSNFVTIAGLFLVATAIGLMLTFWLFTLVTRHPNPYLDIVGYLVLPDLMGVASVVPLAASHPEEVKTVIRLHRLANEMSALV